MSIYANTIVPTMISDITKAVNFQYKDSHGYDLTYEQKMDLFDALNPFFFDDEIVLAELLTELATYCRKTKRVSLYRKLRAIVNILERENTKQSSKYIKDCF